MSGPKPRHPSHREKQWNEVALCVWNCVNASFDPLRNPATREVQGSRRGKTSQRILPDFCRSTEVLGSACSCSDLPTTCSDHKFQKVSSQYKIEIISSLSRVIASTKLKLFHCLHDLFFCNVCQSSSGSLHIIYQKTGGTQLAWRLATYCFTSQRTARWITAGQQIVSVCIRIAVQNIQKSKRNATSN